MQIIYGINPLMEIFLSQPALLEKVIVAEGRGGEALHKIQRLAAEHEIPVEFCARAQVEKLAPRQVHQGVLGFCREYAYATLDEVIAHRGRSSRHDLVIVLDSVTDPQNLGSIIRTAHCCGANGLIIPENRAASVTASVIKVSAGAAQHLPTAMVVNLARTIEYLKERGFWIYGADGSSDVDMNTPDYEGPVCLVLGSEGRGIRPLIRKKCDFLISIPMKGEFSSLNVSVAAGVILYTILGKWDKGGN